MPITSKIPGTIYLEYQVLGERKGVCLHTKDVDTALLAADSMMGKIRRVSSREAYLKAVVAMGDDARRELGETLFSENSPLLDEAWQNFVDSRKRPNSGPTTMTQYRGQWYRFRKWLPQRCRRICDVYPALCEQYVKELDADDVKGGTVAKHIFLLRLVFRVLQPNAANPFAGIRSMRDNTITPHRRLWPEELTKLSKYRAAPFQKEWPLLILLGYSTAQREVDCVLLDWEFVDLKKGLIDFTPQKTRRRTGRRVFVPISPELKAALTGIPKSDRTGYVLKQMAAHYLRNRHYVTKYVATAFKTCKIESNRLGTADFRSLRTTWQTCMEEAGMSRVFIRSVTGHASDKQSNAYSDVDPAMIKAKVAAGLPRLRAKK